jgi:hypothetical protein
LGSAAASDRLVLAAGIVGLLALALTAALALQVLLMRHRAARRERRNAMVLAAWRPLLFGWIVGDEPALPVLLPPDEEAFLLLWNQLQDRVLGEARDRLGRLGERAGAHAMARRRLARGDALDRLLALRTLGYLARPDDYPDVARWLDDRRSYLCIAAARALVHIGPGRAPGDLLPRLARRVDWPVALFATMLAEADPEETARHLREVLRGLPRDPLVRMLPLVTVVDGGTADEILGGLLASSTDPEILSAALKRAESPRLLPHVRRACVHPEWAVRTQAAAALGRVGERGDREPLLRLLCDPGWWVRYRAAQALLSGRFGAATEIAALALGLGDRYARDIVEHVLAEVRG